MSTASPPLDHRSTRYHSLDALRAVAMLAGVVLHAVWMYCPADTRAPIVDQSAAQAPYYALFLIHMFRMQAFFLIAGFFAHLVYSRRGGRVFLSQRLRRIGIPLLVGWLILFPMIKWCYLWGNSESGAAVSGLTISQAFWQSFTDWKAFKASFSFTHLWFLYLLLIFYCATLASVWLGRAMKFPSNLSVKWRGIFARIIRSRWNVVPFALITAVFMYRLGWFGIDTPKNLVPIMGSFMIYWLLFLVGWFLHANVQLLTEFDKRWKLQSCVGLTLSVPLFLFVSNQRNEGKLTHHKEYPALNGTEVQDWPGLQKDLLIHSGDRSEQPQAKVWRALPEPVRDLIQDTPPLGYKQKTAIAMQLNYHVLAQPDFFEAAGLAKSAKETMLLNRKHLEAAFPGRIVASTLNQPFYQWAKPIFALVYAVATWCLVFGCIGLFRRYFSAPSATWRYIADSSYWMYLIHLPVLFVIEIPMMHWEAHWALKLAILNAACFGVLLVSYHYLVRSSMIGESLNGRRYPFVSLFGRRPSTGTLDTRAVSP